MRFWKHEAAAAVDDRLPLGLYKAASAMESQLRAQMDRDPYAPLTGDQASAYNRLVEAARDLAPGSVALREDVAMIENDDTFAVDDAFRAVHVTLLPVIHNALPEADYVAV